MSPTAEAKKTLNVLRLPAVRAKTQLPTSTIYAMMAAGKFPKPIALSVNTRGWIEADIDEFLHARIAERDAGDSWRSLGDAAARVVEKLEPRK
jgi:prophage regulatory protein